MVVEVFVAQGDERAQAVLDPVGVAVIGEAVRHLVKERQAPLDPSQQQGAGIGSDGTLGNSENFPRSRSDRLFHNLCLPSDETSPD